MLNLFKIAKTLHIGFYCEHKNEYYFLAEARIKPSGDVSVFPNYFLDEDRYSKHITHHEKTETSHLRINNKNKSISMTELYPYNGNQKTKKICKDFKSNSISQNGKDLFSRTPMPDNQIKTLLDNKLIVKLDPIYNLQDVQIYSKILPKDKIRGYLELYTKKKLVTYDLSKIDDNFVICTKIITDIQNAAKVLQ